MKNKQDLEVHVGTLLKNLPEQHDIEFKVGFNLHSNTFFQKLVSKELIEKGVRIHTDDFYKGLVFLDYFCGVIENDYRVCDNLVKISKALRKAEKEKGEDKNASYLKLGVVVEEATLCAKENSDDYSDGIRRYMKTPSLFFYFRVDPPNGILSEVGNEMVEYDRHFKEVNIWWGPNSTKVKDKKYY